MSGSLPIRMPPSVLAGALALLAMSATAMSQAPVRTAPASHGSVAERAGHVVASLVAEQDTVVPGSVARLGVRLLLDEGWHVYAAARNDSGLPVLVRPELPDGWVAEPLQWPAPHRHLSPGPLLDHVYDDEVLLMFAVRVPADAQPGQTVTLRAHLEWLVCNQVCVAGGADVSLSLPVARPGSPPAPGSFAPLFAAAAARLPEAWPTPGAPSATATGDAAPIRVEFLSEEVRLIAPGALSITLLPAEDCVELPFLVDEGVAQGDTLRLHPAKERPPGARLKGCVDVRYPGDSQAGPTRARVFALDLPTPIPSDPIPASTSGETR